MRDIKNITTRKGPLRSRVFPPTQKTLVQQLPEPDRGEACPAQAPPDSADVGPPAGRIPGRLASRIRQERRFQRHCPTSPEDKAVHPTRPLQVISACRRFTPRPLREGGQPPCAPAGRRDHPLFNRSGTPGAGKEGHGNVPGAVRGIRRRRAENRQDSGHDGTLLPRSPLEPAILFQPLSHGISFQDNHRGCGPGREKSFS